MLGESRPGVPTGRRRTGEVGDDPHRLGQVGPLDVDVDVLVADPPQPVAGDLVAGPDQGLGDGRVALEGPGHGEGGQRQAPIGEQAQHPLTPARLPYS